MCQCDNCSSLVTVIESVCCIEREDEIHYGDRTGGHLRNGPPWLSVNLPGQTGIDNAYLAYKQQYGDVEEFR